MVKQTVFFRFGPAKPQKCAINLLNQQYWYEFPALFRTNKWLFRLALAILALLKSAKKLQKQRKTTAKAVVFVVDDIGLGLLFCQGENACRVVEGTNFHTNIAPKNSY